MSILKSTIVIFALIVGVSAAALAQTAKTPAKPAKPAAKTPAATKPAKAPDVKPEVRAILDKLEKAGDKYKTLKADINYEVEMRLTGEVETRDGYVVFQRKTAKTPDKFRIHFETLRLDQGKRTKSPLDYIFDGQWLTIAKHAIKSMTKIQVVAKGEQVEPLKIGKGPFPVPFGQKTDDVVAYMEVTKRKARKKDPKNTDCLRFVPRKKHKDEVNFTRMDLWIDRTTNLPVKVSSRDKNKNITTVTFTNIKTQTTIDPKLFTMARPAGWDLTIERK